MFRAVIADDEPKVCQLIRMLGDWEKFGIEIVKVCYDGEELLRVIEEEQPDIVVTDIRMPIYDGLEIIRRTKEMGLGTAFVIISGYRHFEYAHSAIQYGVADYLLKPIEEETLNLTLQKVCGKLESGNRQKEQETLLNNLMNRSRTQQVERFLQDVWEQKVSKRGPEEIKERYGVDFADGQFQVFVIIADQVELLQPDSLSAEKVMEGIARIFGSQACIFTGVDVDGICGILQYPDGQEEVKRGLYSLFNEIKSFTDIYGDFRLVFGTAGPAGTPVRLEECLREAERYARARLILGWDRIIDKLPSYLEERIQADDLLNAGRKKSFYNALETFQKEELYRWFCDTAEIMEKSVHALTPECPFQVRDILLKEYRERREQLDVREAPEAEVLLRQTEHAGDIGQMMKQLADAYQMLVTGYLEQKESRESRPVLVAKQYIGEHFAESILLEDVAAAVNFSPVYFSGLFKKYTGQGFGEYVTEVRIREAKRLLRETSESIAEIAGKVGYQDSKYFRKLFKKVTGMKPSDFRRLYQ